MLGVPLVGTLCLPFVFVGLAHTSQACDMSLSYSALLNPVLVKSSFNKLLSGGGSSNMTWL